MHKGIREGWHNNRRGTASHVTPEGIMWDVGLGATTSSLRIIGGAKCDAHGLPSSGYGVGSADDSHIEMSSYPILTADEAA